MQLIKSFFVFKNKTDKEKAPTHTLSAKVEDSFVEIGAGWTKEGKSGKFISAQLSKPYQDKRRGVVMVFEDELRDLCGRAGEDYPDISL